jgi:hypothetical protein
LVSHPREEDRLTGSEIRALRRMYGLKDLEEEEKDAANVNCIKMRFIIFILPQVFLGLSNEG